MYSKYKKALIIDIEGNSTKQKNELKITQFSALVFNYGKKVEEINLYNRNVNYINPYVRKLTKIELVTLKKDGFSEKHLIEEIYNLVKDADIVYGYDPSFDAAIMRMMFKKYKLKPLKINWCDVQKMIKVKINPEKLALSSVAPALGFSESSFHNSLIDCRATHYLLDYLSKDEVKV